MVLHSSFSRGCQQLIDSALLQRKYVVSIEIWLLKNGAGIFLRMEILAEIRDKWRSCIRIWKKAYA